MATTKPIRDLGTPVIPVGTELILIDNGVSMKPATINDAVNPKASALIAANNAVYDPQGIAGDAFARANHTGTQTLSTISDAGTAAAAATTDFATAAQGALADTATQPGDLGNSAALDVGTTPGTVAAGDDSRITGAIQSTANDASSFGFVLDEDDMASDSAQKVPTQQSVKAYIGNLFSAFGASLVLASTYVAAWVLLKVHGSLPSRTLVKAVSASAGMSVYLTETGREGSFVFNSSNLSAKVTVDTQEGIYLAPTSDPTGASGAWVRAITDGNVLVTWCGAKCDGSTDDLAAINGAIAINPSGGIEFPSGTITNISAAIVPPQTTAVTLFSKGAKATIRTTSATDDIIRVAATSGNMAQWGVVNLLLDATVDKTAGYGVTVTSGSGYSHFFTRMSDLHMSKKMYGGINWAAGGFYAYFSDIFINGVGTNGQGLRFKGVDSSTRFGSIYMHDVRVINGRSNAGTFTMGWQINDFCEGLYSERVTLESSDLNIDLLIANSSGITANAPKNLWFSKLIADNANGAGISIAYAHTVRFTDSWTTSSIGGSGVDIQAGVDIEFKGHTAIGNYDSGILIRAGATQVRVLGGAINGNNQRPSGTSSGVDVVAGTTDFSIIDVEFFGTATQLADINIATGASDRYIIKGNRLLSGVSYSLKDGGTGQAKDVKDNIDGKTGTVSYASAATLVLPQFRDVFIITGTASISAISTPAYVGRRITFIFSGAATMVNGSTLKLRGGANWTATAFVSTITLISDGTNWYEEGR